MKTEQIERNIDLKWSAWTSDRSSWIEHGASEVVEIMKSAFRGDGPTVVVASSPKKESRSAKVTIEKGKAHGCFVAAWSDIEELADTLGIQVTDDDSLDAFAETLPFSQEADGPGFDREFSVEAQSFEWLMELIDAEEKALIEEDAKAWEEIEAMFAGSKPADDE